LPHARRGPGADNRSDGRRPAETIFLPFREPVSEATPTRSALWVGRGPAGGVLVAPPSSYHSARRSVAVETCPSPEDHCAASMASV